MTRANELRTRTDVANAFVRTGSARVIVPIIVVLAIGRLMLGEWGRGDLAMAITIVAMTGTVEWVIHRYLLHAPPQAWISRRLGTGAGHREHHLDPPELRWLLLRGIDAAMFLAALTVFSAAWSIPLAWVVGGNVGPSYLTAVALTALGLGRYEWTHLLIHSAHRPRSSYYARLAANHRRHHYRNERYWLGVTSNSGDRLLRTLPSAVDDVVRSETARTL